MSNWALVGNITGLSITRELFADEPFRNEVGSVEDLEAGPHSKPPHRTHFGARSASESPCRQYDFRAS